MEYLILAKDLTHRHPFAMRYCGVIPPLFSQKYTLVVANISRLLRRFADDLHWFTMSSIKTSKKVIFCDLNHTGCLFK